MKSDHDARRPKDSGKSPESLLRRLDLAQEVLEGLDELGVQDRDELLALMDALEQHVTDEQ